MATSFKNRLKGMQEELRMTDYQVEELGKLLVGRRRMAAVFQKKWAKSGTHELKIVNLATPGRRIYDVDALAIVH